MPLDTTLNRCLASPRGPPTARSTRTFFDMSLILLFAAGLAQPRRWTTFALPGRGEVGPVVRFPIAEAGDGHAVSILDAEPGVRYRCFGCRSPMVAKRGPKRA